jgi:hypothetical protein
LTRRRGICQIPCKRERVFGEVMTVVSGAAQGPQTWEAFEPTMKRPQFRLKTLLLLVTIIAVACWLSRHVTIDFKYVARCEVWNRGGNGVAGPTGHYEYNPVLMVVIWWDEKEILWWNKTTTKLKQRPQLGTSLIDERKPEKWRAP